MALIGTTIALGTVLGTLVPSGGGNLRQVWISNEGAGTLYVGGSDITIGTIGYKIFPGSIQEINLWSDEVLYGINSTTTGTIGILRRA